MELHQSLESLLDWVETCQNLVNGSKNSSIVEVTRTDEQKTLNFTLDSSHSSQLAISEQQSSATLLTHDQEEIHNTLPETVSVSQESDEEFKWRFHYQLQQLLKSEKFPRAIALVEGLAMRLPQDPDVRQWRARVYQLWGRQLCHSGELDKARIYLKKALKTDPHNPHLWSEVNKDFRSLEVDLIS